MRIFTVSELTGAVKHVLESEFPFVWVQGQVGNVSHPASGHLYFSLGDDQAVLSVVWFKGAQRPLTPGGVDPVTGEVFDQGRGVDLAEGMEVLCAGRINVYAPRGAYQLVAELVQEKGLGELWLQFEALKRALAEQGWFDAGRKRPLPPHPTRVAVVTSPRGAAVRDFLRLADERGWGSCLRIVPALVQGRGAPESIASAMAQACADNWPQVVVLIRGGGSLEDLWAFNTETVARAVFECPAPVVCGVGHEVDVTIADMVADARAATPSHAAQLLWPERQALVQAVDHATMSLGAALEDFLGQKSQSLASLERALRWLSPGARVARGLETLGREARALAVSGRGLAARRQDQARALANRLALAGGVWLRGREQALALAKADLAGRDPAKPLERGYSLVSLRHTGRILRHVAQAAPGQALDIRVRDGLVTAEVLDAVPDVVLNDNDPGRS